MESNFQQLPDSLLKELSSLRIKTLPVTLDYPYLTEPDTKFKTSYKVTATLDLAQDRDIIVFDLQEELDVQLKAKDEKRSIPALELSHTDILELLNQASDYAARTANADEIAAQEKHAQAVKAAKEAGAKLPVRKAKDLFKATTAYTEVDEQIFQIKLTSNFAPVIVTADGKKWGTTPETEGKRVFPGSEARLIFTISPWNSPTGCGAALKLVAVQVLRNGQARNAQGDGSFFNNPF